LDAAIIQANSSEFLREHIYPGAPPDGANTFNYTFSSTGPSFPSVVPDEASIWYVGRFVTTEQAGDAVRRITNCAKGAALATETTVEIETITATNHKIPNETLARLMHDNLAEIGPPIFSEEEQAAAKEIQRERGAAPTGIPESIRPFDGGYSVVCDTSEYSWNAPYATAWIAMAPENIGWHNRGVTYCGGNSMGRKSMDTAAKVLAATAIDLFCDPSIIDVAKAEWAERLDGKTYECLI
jgi:aminobenzoyl-glutamate utilization protein B